MFKISKHKGIVSHFILFSLLLPLMLLGSESDSTKNVKYLALPVFFKTPELGYAGGLSGTASFRTTFYNDTLTRPSLLQVLGFFTSRQVNAQAINAYIFFPKENNILLFQTTHQYFPDKFWGLGANTQPNDLSNYLFEIFNLNPHFKHKVAKRIYVGLLADYQRVFKMNYQPGSSFERSNFVGKKPYEVAALGMSLTYDTRSNNFWPLKGIFISSQILHYEKKYISDFTFTKSITDIRLFQKIFRNQILALQFYSFQTFGSTPIRDLAALGGPNNLRGIYLGRFRALKALTFISEYRFKIHKQFNAVLFGGVGQIYNSSKDLNLSASKFSFGGGLRFAFVKKEGLNLRLDYGYSNKTDQGFYFTIGECF